MERIYVLTREMLGLNWSRLIRRAAVRSGFYFVAALSFAALSGGRWAISISAALVGSAVDFVAFVLVARLYAPSRLRLTDDSIEEVDGPVVRKNEIIELNERSDSDPRGLEVVGQRKSRWLPKYRIFVPTSVAGFDELRVLVCEWKDSEQSRQTAAPRCNSARDA